MCVDGTDFSIAEPWPWRDGYNEKFFSKKIQGAAFRYEVATCIQTGDIVWVNGPFKAGRWHDLTIYRRDLKHLLAPGEMVEADKGYRGDETIRNPRTVFSRADKRAKELVHARHETVNRHFKQYQALSSKYRHERSIHQYVFHSITVITQITFDEGFCPFQVNY